MDAAMCQSSATSLCHLHIDALWITSIWFWGVGAGIYDKFAEAFTKAVSELHVGNGLEKGVTQVCTTHSQLHTLRLPAVFLHMTIRLRLSELLSIENDLLK